MDNKILNELYYNPKTGYNSLSKFYSIVRKLHPDILYKDVESFYKNQSINQIYAPPSTKYLKIKCPFNNVGCLQSDLQDMGIFSCDLAKIPTKFFFSDFSFLQLVIMIVYAKSSNKVYYTKIIHCIFLTYIYIYLAIAK